MYQIDKIKRVFIDPDTNTTKSILDKTDGFLLHNLTRYSFDGSFLSEAAQKDYDRHFAAYLDSEINLKKHEIKAFLDFHFKSTPNKKLFIEHLEYYIIPDFMLEKDPVRLKIIAEWIEENKTIKTRQIKNETGLSVSDWAIIFYFIDKAGEQKGAKTKRWEKFIEEKDIRNEEKELVSSGYFKRKYYDIEKKINQKNGAKPLPPERIKKILPYLTNNKKALELANNDMVYLTDEVNEYKDNNE